jgi:hypothetical protein
MYWCCKRCGKHDPKNINAAGFHANGACETQDVPTLICERLEKGEDSIEELYGHALNNGWFQVLYGWAGFIEALTSMGFTLTGDRISL